MRLDGFPDLIRTAIFNQGITQAKTSLAEASIELVTGIKENLSIELSGQVGEYNLVSKALADIESSEARVTLADNRLSQTGNTVGAIRSVVEAYSSEAQAALVNNEAYGLVEVQASAVTQIDSIMTLLNTSYGGRSLFSGDEVGQDAVVSSDVLLTEIANAIGGATDEATIDAAITAFFDDGGGYDTLIYQGGAGEASEVQLTSGLAVQYETKADAQAFKDSLEGLVRITYTTSSSSSDWANTATANLSGGVAGLIEIEANIGRERNLIDTAKGLMEEETMLLTESKTALDGVDVYEAANRVQALEAQLEAAYTVASRLSQLSLTSYI